MSKTLSTICNDANFLLLLSQRSSDLTSAFLDIVREEWSDDSDPKLAQQWVLRYYSRILKNVAKYFGNSSEAHIIMGTWDNANHSWRNGFIDFVVAKGGKLFTEYASVKELYLNQDSMLEESPFTLLEVYKEDRQELLDYFFDIIGRYLSLRTLKFCGGQRVHYKPVGLVFECEAFTASYSKIHHYHESIADVKDLYTWPLAGLELALEVSESDARALALSFGYAWNLLEIVRSAHVSGMIELPHDDRYESLSVSQQKSADNAWAYLNKLCMEAGL